MVEVKGTQEGWVGKVFFPLQLEEKYKDTRGEHEEQSKKKNGFILRNTSKMYTTMETSPLNDVYTQYSV